MTTTEFETKQDNLFSHAQVLKTITTGPQRTLLYGGVFEEQPTNPTLLATCKQIYNDQSFSAKPRIQEYLGADEDFDSNLIQAPNTHNLMLQKISTSMDQLLAQANRISKPWVPELYTLLLRVGVLFERNFEFLPLQRTCLDKVLKSILNDIETKQADSITFAERDMLKAVVEHLESSNSFLMKTKY